ncbi:hypothetical protein LTR64_004737 [Lithohypha guttulata]|uniref:uncharacterized protein n=1 Tax=Lithohypha guttulata TaxID=1690604 RepID=UPI002DE1407C|nr:hypothetical protein LTR51_005966 [Lithohypha guttulata]
MATMTAPLSPQQSRSERSERPRATSMLSYSSLHSHKTGRTKEDKKLELVEAAKDKKRLAGKADPTKALQEEQPASYGGYDSSTKRTSYYGAPTQVSTAYAPNGRYSQRPINGQGGYYRNSTHGGRSDLVDENGPQGHPRHGRYVSAPYNMQTGESPQSFHSHQQSYETMTSGSDEMSKSTNPSSQNSSFDQIHQINNYKKQDHGYEGNQYRQHGGPMRNPYPPSAMPNGYGNHMSGPTDDYGVALPQSGPQPPPKAPIALNSGRPQRTNPITPPEETKRKSWIKRTFSKRN